MTANSEHKTSEFDRFLQDEGSFEKEDAVTLAKVAASGVEQSAGMYNPAHPGQVLQEWIPKELALETAAEQHRSFLSG